jgi:cytoskeletal protein RodZ
MKEIGVELHDLRVSQGVSLEEAANDLKVDSSDLSNLEDGVTRAFKDIFYLKKLVLEYSKYLGLDQEKVMDDFNDFMYEKTSKISLEDLQKTIEMEQLNKIHSPYTKIPKEKKSHFKQVLIVLGIIIILVLVYLIFYLYLKGNPATYEL